MSNHQITELTNGMRIASEALPGVESVAVAVSVNVGARYETEAECGISHLLEHMAFKGTATRSARQIAEEFDNIGGQFNAYTSLEHTVYYAKVLKDHLPVAIDILSDILQHSCMDASELAREQDVVLQEIAAHQDTPDDLIFDLFDAVAYPYQPLGRSILGTPEQVSSYRREHIIAYMQKHYGARRMVLSAAGNVSHSQLVSLAESCFNHLGVVDNVTPSDGRYGGGASVTQRDLEQLHVLMGFPALSIHHEDYFALQLFSLILGGGMSSRLFQEVREKRGLAYHVSSMVTSYHDCGMLSIYSATSEDQSAQLPFILADELKKMAEGISDAELTRVKNQQKAELLMARESPGTVAGRLGKHLLIFGRVRTLDEVLRRVDEVTKDDIIRMAKAVLSTKQPTLAALGPTGKLPSLDMITTHLHA